jgi:hypothetical protein
MPGRQTFSVESSILSPYFHVLVPNLRSLRLSPSNPPTHGAALNAALLSPLLEELHLGDNIGDLQLEILSNSTSLKKLSFRSRPERASIPRIKPRSFSRLESLRVRGDNGLSVTPHLFIPFNISTLRAFFSQTRTPVLWIACPQSPCILIYCESSSWKSMPQNYSPSPPSLLSTNVASSQGSNSAS